MTAPHLTADDSAVPEGPQPTMTTARTVARGELGVIVACPAAGVALGGLWVLAAGAAVGATDAPEHAAASDSVFALLSLGFGLVAALALAVFPGHHQVLRAGIALAGSVVGGFVGLAVGLVLGAAPLRADGFVLAWPIALGTVTTLRLLVVHLLGRE